MGPYSDDVGAGDYNKADTIIVIGEGSDGDDVDNGKDDVNTRRRKKIMNEFFIIIPINSQKILKRKRKKYDYCNKLSYVRIC